MQIVPPVMMINTRDSGRLASGVPPSIKNCPISPGLSCWMASFLVPFVMSCSVLFYFKKYILRMVYLGYSTENY